METLGLRRPDEKRLRRLAEQAKPVLDDKPVLEPEPELTFAMQLESVRCVCACVRVCQLPPACLPACSDFGLLNVTACLATVASCMACTGTGC